jgi:hypothetical protein
MPKKVIFFLFIILIFGSLAVWYFFFLPQGPVEPDFGDSGKTDFFPFGRPDNIPGPAGTGGTNETGPGGEFPPTGFIPALRQISHVPTSGAIAFMDPAATGTIKIRYIERATGHIFETTTAQNAVRRISNTTIPAIQEAMWLKDGNSLILRYLEDDMRTIRGFYGKISLPEEGGSEEVGSLEGVFIPENILAFDISPDSENMFYLVRDSGKTLGIISRPDGTDKTQIFESPLREWLVEWAEKSTITLTTKASASVPGYSYFLDSATGNFSKILGNKPGLTTLTNPDASKILYGENIHGKIALQVYDVSKHTSQSLPIATLPEKCAWKDTVLIFCGVPANNTLSGEYPDIWYQGLVSFSDDIWRINLDTEEVDLVTSLKDLSGVDIDSTEPFLDPSGTFLFFINKNDLTLWVLRLAA